MNLTVAILGTEILRIETGKPAPEPPAKGDCISVGFIQQIGEHE